MATTTNYSFPTPDDTDLVKDGASAIRSFGTAVDTQIKDLSPGTTAGDIDYYTTSTDKARVAIGTAGQILAVNSGATAPEWVAAPTGGSLTQLATGTLSGTTVTISSISSSYTHLLLYVTGHKDGSGAMLNMRLNGITTSSYRDVYMKTGATANTAGATTTFGNIGECAQTAATSKTTVLIPFYNDATATHQFNSIANAGNAAYNITGYFAPTGAITSLSMGAGGFVNTFTGGTYYLYGVK